MNPRYRSVSSEELFLQSQHKVRAFLVPSRSNIVQIASPMHVHHQNPSLCVSELGIQWWVNALIISCFGTELLREHRRYFYICAVPPPVSLPRAACRSSRPLPGQGAPGRTWTDRWCRRVTGLYEPSKTRSNWFLPPPYCSCSSPAGGAPSRTANRAKWPPRQGEACDSPGPACCTPSVCCSGRRRGSPGILVTRYLNQKEKEQYLHFS